ncbi:MAG: LuxR C-terminal-related transcriptional regulator, partial [Humibacillus sp.]|nr:LuxR C-terminal-related transcriptional regulator [Humibacillus sp.]
QDPAAEAQCRRRAASWLLAHQDYVGGVEQLLAVGDHAAAFEILAAEGHRLFERGETASLVRFLTLVHEADVSPGPLVAITLLAAQVAADEFGSAAENYRTLNRRSDLTPGERIAIDALASVMGLAYLPLDEIRRLTDGALRSLPEVDPASVPDFAGAGGADSCEAIASIFSSLGALFAGDLDASASGLEQALELPGLKYLPWQINALGMLALTRAWEGRLTDAKALALTALDAARGLAAVDHISTTYAHLALAMLTLDRLDLGAAEIHLDMATSCVDRSRRPTLAHFLHLLKVRHLALTGGVHAALERLRDVSLPIVGRPLIEEGLTTLEAQLLARSGSVRQARALLDSVRAPVPAARIDVLVATGHVTQAREVLDQWTPPATNLRACLERDLRRAIVTQQEGNRGLSGMLVADAAVRADTEGLLAPFVEAPVALSLLRTAAPARRLHRARALLDPTLKVEGSASNDQLVEQLTPREVVVLEYLPSRLGNDQIADALYVSVNTLKTHLRNIYRKLDAPDRDAAVERATSIGLI